MPPLTSSFPSFRIVLFLLFISSSFNLVEQASAFPFTTRQAPTIRPQPHRVVGTFKASSFSNYLPGISMPMTTTPSSSSSTAHANEASSSSSLPSDFVRKVYLLLGSTTSTFVAGTFFYFLATRRDAFMVAFFLGAISNGILSKVMKRIFNQQRPAADSDDNSQNDGATTVVSLLLTTKPSDNGMPSSHAMSLGFIGIFTILSLLEASSFSTSVVLAPSIILYVLVSLVYRVEKQLHTTEQIGVGLALGSIYGFIWKQLCSTSSSLTLGGMTIPSIQNSIQSLLTYWSPQDHLLPTHFLVIPALVGAIVVGSLERRIAALWKYYNNRSKAE